MYFNFDPTITISILIAVIAFVSPVATALINNHHQTTMKKLEMYADEKRKALNQFISATEIYINHEDNMVPIDVMASFYSSINSLYVYFDISDYSIFEQLENVIKECDVFKSHRELVNVVIVLSKQIEKQ